MAILRLAAAALLLANLNACKAPQDPEVGPTPEEIEEEGFPTLVKIAIEGQNGMPPRGTCFDCSDEEIEATVLYMLKESGAK